MARVGPFLLLLLAPRLPALGSAPQYDAYPPRQLEPASDPRSWGVADVQDWVESTGFYEYREAFLEGMVDGKRLLRMGEDDLSERLLLPSAEHAALLAMEIGELRARRGLFTPAERQAHFAAHPLAETWNVDGVQRFLQEAGFGRYAAGFARAAVNGPALLRLSDAELGALVGAYAQGDEHEEGAAAVEQLAALVAHLRWRSAGAAKGAKEEL